MCRIRAYDSGSCLRSQSSFGAVNPVSARLPVNSINRSRPIRCSISAHSAAVRWSFQRIAGRITRASPSSATRPCIWPESPTAPSGSRARQAWAARHQSAGSCSAQPGSGVESGYGSSAVASNSPSGEIAIALTPVVPTSSPISASGTQGGVDEFVGADCVFVLLGGAEGGVVDGGGDAVDEVPVQDGAFDGGDGVFGVGVEVEAEPFAAAAVVGAAELDRELEGFHEGCRADHVVVVEGAPAGVGVLVAEQAFAGEQGGVFGQVLAVH